MTVVPLSPHLVDVFGTKKPFTMLLRPDNYLAAIWPGLDTTPAVTAVCVDKQTLDSPNPL